MAARKRGNTKRKRRNSALALLCLPVTLADRVSRRFPRWAQRLTRLSAVCIALGVVAFISLVAIYGLRAQKYDLDQVAIMPERNIVYFSGGEEIGRMHGEKRDVAPISEISEHFLKAIVAREDARFYDHGAVDPKGIARALVRNIKDGGVSEGASTITMQLARNSFDDMPSNDFDRKLLETALAFRIERRYSKDEILQHYCNRIFWGHTIQGIEEASRTYFEKSAKDLTLSESAMLAGIVRGPNLFSPFKDVTKSLRERDTTLDSMVRFGFIEEAEANAAKAEELDIRPKDRRVFKNTYAFEAIRSELELILSEHNIQWGGLRVHTTLDAKLQDRAVRSLNDRINEYERRSGWPHQTRVQFQLSDGSKDPEYIQGAVVSIANTTGAVRVMVGGRDAAESHINRAFSKRPVGSLFKPFYYAKAYEMGLRPETLISDDRLAAGEVKGAPAGWPRNSDGKYNGTKPVNYGLYRSRNTMSVRVGNYVGLPQAMELAHSVGFDERESPTLSDFLGSWSASPYQVATAYTLFPNNGVRMRPYLIEKITDQDDNVLYESGHIAIPSLGPGAAWQASQTMRRVTQSGGTAGGLRRFGVKFDTAGKTGTTNEFRDAWFAGYTSSLTTVVWVGSDQNRTIIDRGYGSTFAVPVWADVMKAAGKLGYPMESLVGSPQLIDVELCRLSGKRATDGCRAHGTSYLSRVPADIAPQPNDFCPVHPVTAQPIDPNRLPANPSPAGRVVPAERVVPAGRVTPAAPVTPAERVEPPRAEPVR